jgi:hypothetical protein
VGPHGALRLDRGKGREADACEEHEEGPAEPRHFEGSGKREGGSGGMRVGGRGRGGEALRKIEMVQRRDNDMDVWEV